MRGFFGVATFFCERLLCEGPCGAALASLVFGPKRDVTRSTDAANMNITITGCLMLIIDVDRSYITRYLRFHFAGSQSV
jgi:hypothetical protein